MQIRTEVFHNATLEEGGPSGAHTLSSVREVYRGSIRGGVVEGHGCCDEKVDKVRLKGVNEAKTLDWRLERLSRNRSSI